MKKYFLLPILSIASLSLLSGCNTTSVGISDYKNPAPSVPLSQFARYELAPVTMAKAFEGQKPNEKAMEKLQEEIGLRFDSVLEGWNAREGATGDTLLIEPHIREIKFISGGSRFWAGAMAGDSAIVCAVTFRNKETGEVVASPSFYQHANALGGAWSIGGTDNAMINRMAGLIVEFANNNFDQAVGGPTGKPEPGKK